MNYQVIIPKAVQKQLNKLSEEIRNRLISEIIVLQSNPRGKNCLKMQNTLGFRLKIGDYRVLYDINDQSKIVTLRRIAHRRDVYRQK